jgi:hypothetical protein
MSNNGGFIPKGVTHYAMQLVAKFKLDKGASILPIERIIQSAIDDDRETRRLREELGCMQCGITMLRYQAVRAEFSDLCPGCRGSMLPTPALDRRKVLELERREHERPT